MNWTSVSWSWNFWKSENISNKLAKLLKINFGKIAI